LVLGLVERKRSGDEIGRHGALQRGEPGSDHRLDAGFPIDEGAVAIEGQNLEAVKVDHAVTPKPSGGHCQIKLVCYAQMPGWSPAKRTARLFSLQNK
jgi:hypothetical protein